MLLDASLLQTQSKENQTVFIKHKEVVSKEFRYIEVGLKEEMEFNQFKEQTTHQLLPLSHAFNEAGVFLKTTTVRQQLLPTICIIAIALINRFLIKA